MEENRRPVPDDGTGEAAPAPQGKTTSKPARRRTPRNASKDSLHYARVRRLMRDEAFLFKVLAALVVGIVAAVIIVVAGLEAERQSYVVMNRAIVGFSVSAMVMFLACFWLDKRGIPLYVSKHQELQSSWVSEPDDAEEEALLAEMADQSSAEEAVEKEAEGAGEAEPETAEEQDTEAAEETGEPVDGFAPLEDSAEHLKVPR